MSLSLRLPCQWIAGESCSTLWICRSSSLIWIVRLHLLFCLSFGLSGYICFFVFQFVLAALLSELSGHILLCVFQFVFAAAFGSDRANQNLLLKVLLHLKWNRDDGVVTDKEGKSARQGSKVGIWEPEQSKPFHRDGKSLVKTDTYKSGRKTCAA